jgi:[acyl-carrier-protein] S-malonyltransferase
MMIDKEKTAVIFPGQGGQYPGMGKELFDSYPSSRKVFEVSRKVTGIAVDELCFQGSPEQLKETLSSQLCVLTVSLAAFEALRSAASGFGFNFAAGLSLGEYSALYAAGVLSLEDTFDLVRRRAGHMQKACAEKRGTMVSLLGMDESKAWELCGEVNGFCAVANLNCPGQVVVSCDKDVVNEVMEKAKSKGSKKAIELQVAGAFHSDHMASASKGFSEDLKDISFEKNNVSKVVFNLTARAGSPQDDLRSILEQQMVRPVLWEKSVKYMIEKGVTTFIEIGPGNILGGLLKRIDKSAAYLNIENIATLKETVEKARQ